MSLSEQVKRFIPTPKGIEKGPRPAVSSQGDAAKAADPKAIELAKTRLDKVNARMNRVYNELVKSDARFEELKRTPVDADAPETVHELAAEQARLEIARERLGSRMNELRIEAEAKKRAHGKLTYPTHLAAVQEAEAAVSKAIQSLIVTTAPTVARFLAASRAATEAARAGGMTERADRPADELAVLRDALDRAGAPA